MGVFVEKERVRIQVEKTDPGFILDSATGEFLKDDLAGQRRELTWAQIAGYSCEFATSKDLFEGAYEMKQLLTETTLPLSHQLSTIEGIDTFFANRPGWSVKSLSLNHIASELTAAKLNDKRDFHEAYVRIAEEIDNRINHFGMSLKIKKVTEALYQYLQNY